MDDSSAKESQLKVFRAKDAPTLAEKACMVLEPMTAAQSEGMEKLVEAGFLQGEEVRILVDMPGFFLAHVWFKGGFPLPRHSHDVDCMYYVIAGRLQLGTHDLGPKDSFFVPAGVPYTYTPGPDGVEVLEIRHATRFNFLTHIHNDSWWNKAEESVLRNVDAWKDELPPSH